MQNWKNYCCWIDIQILTLCLCPFAAILMQNVFNFYYVKIFLQNYALAPRWFQLGQIFYLIWNTFNDPIFGCWQNGQKTRWWHRRQKVILFVGPFYALSFLVPWFPWGAKTGAPWVAGAHFVTSLFIYDGLYSFVLIGWCSLYTEITNEHEKRIRAVKYLQIANIVGANSLPIFEKVSHSLSNMAAFQRCAVVVALISILCFVVTGRLTRDEKSRSNEIADTTTENSNIRISLQICTDCDFLTFVFMNFLTVFRTTVHANFTAIFTERLIPREILPKGSWIISIFYGILTILPQILVFVWSPLANKFGTYKIFMTSFACSIIFAAIMGIAGSSCSILIIVFMIIDAICIDSIAPLTTILNADVVDADFEKHNRKFKVSSIFFGLNALITKPAVSMAPMFVVFVLNQCNYERLVTAENLTVAKNVSNIAGSLTVAESIDDLAFWRNEVGNAMFILLWSIPLAIASTQLLVFWKYSLRNTHIDQDKRTDGRP